MNSIVKRTSEINLLGDIFNDNLRFDIHVQLTNYLKERHAKAGVLT